MKLGEGGEAFFVFETSDRIPAALQTSPLSSPATSPANQPTGTTPSIELAEPEPLDLAADTQRGRSRTSDSPDSLSIERRARSGLGRIAAKLYK